MREIDLHRQREIFNISPLETNSISRQTISKDICDLSNKISSPELMVIYRTANPELRVTYRKTAPNHKEYSLYSSM